MSKERDTVDAGTWSAIDGLGRAVPMYGDAAMPAGGKRKDRYVGMFYWTWHCQHAKATEPRNVSELLEKAPEALNDFTHPIWQGKCTPHHWNRPLYGYYNTTDRWVLRRHAELLADAGVDVVIFDNTNGRWTWRESYTVLMEVFSEARRDGVKAPCISFILPFAPNDDTNAQLEQLYIDIYQAKKHPELWFYWKGKPMIMAYPDHLHQENPLHREILDFFTFKPGQPQYTVGQTRPDQWGWLSVYPQQIYRNADGSPEQMTVGVAQNHSRELGLTAMNGVNVFGRTYTSKGKEENADAVLYGANFAEQFEYALKVDPEFIFITGWNEWVAGRYQEWCGVKNAFPDQCCDAYSRDIEPSSGRLEDHYYYQLVSYIRRYKGVCAPEKAVPVPIAEISDFRVWDAVKPGYHSYAHNTAPRDADGYLTEHYTNVGGRNDVVNAKVSYDTENLYFFAETVNEITEPEGMWMQLFLRTQPECSTYQYVVNGITPQYVAVENGYSGIVPVCRIAPDGGKVACGEGKFVVQGRKMVVQFPKDCVGISGDSFRIDFKWADNLPVWERLDIHDFYLHGTVTPGGRFHFVYEIGNVPRYPMKLRSEPKQIIWGGNRLKKEYNQIAPFDKIAESWELTVRSDGMNTIENGVCAEMTLGMYIEKYGNGVIADGYDGDRFPLLIKLIDACDRLSIQVHPGDEYSMEREGEFGKTEMWYIVEADEGAQIVYGLKEGISKEDFRVAMERGHIEDVLNYVNVHAGEGYFIPSGLIHAIGAGILIAEIQQNSNITYRVYDYGRQQSDGSLRPLHTEKALDVIQLRTEQEIDEIRFSKGIRETSSLACCAYFTVNQYNISGELALCAEISFHSVLCIGGAGKLVHGEQTYSLTKGDSYYLPAHTGTYRIEGNLSVIISQI